MKKVEQSDVLSYLTGKMTADDLRSKTTEMTGESTNPVENTSEKKEVISENQTKIDQTENKINNEKENRQEEKNLLNDKKEEVEEKDYDDVLSSLSKKYNLAESEKKEDDQTESSLNNNIETESFDLNKIISEKTNGRYKDLDSLLATKEVSNNEPVFASERIKRLNELEQQGVDIMQVLEVERYNVSDLSPDNYNDALQLVKYHYKLDDPTLTDTEINYLIKKDYLINEEEDTEDEINYKKAILKRTARSYKQAIIQKQKDLTIPKPGAKTENIEAQKQAMEQANEAFRNSVKDVFKNYNEEIFNIKDDFTLKFGVNDKMKNQVTQNLNTPVDLWKRYTNDSGNLDTQKLLREVMILDNLDLILRSVADQIENKTSADILGELLNSRPKGSSKKVNIAPEKSFNQKAFEKFKDHIL